MNPEDNPQLTDDDISINEDYQFKDKTYYYIHFKNITGITKEQAEKIKQDILQSIKEYPILQEQFDSAVKTINTLNEDKSKLKESYLERVATANKIISEKIDEIKKLKEEKEELKRKIKHHIEVRASETVYAVWRRELMELIE